MLLLCRPWPLAWKMYISHCGSAVLKALTTFSLHRTRCSILIWWIWCGLSSTGICHTVSSRIKASKACIDLRHLENALAHRVTSKTPRSQSIFKEIGRKRRSLKFWVHLVFFWIESCYYFLSFYIFPHVHHWKGVTFLSMVKAIFLWLNFPIHIKDKISKDSTPG